MSRAQCCCPSATKRNISPLCTGCQAGHCNTSRAVNPAPADSQSGRHPAAPGSSQSAGWRDATSPGWGPGWLCRSLSLLTGQPCANKFLECFGCLSASERAEATRCWEPGCVLVGLSTAGHPECRHGGLCSAPWGANQGLRGSALG